MLLLLIGMENMDDKVNHCFLLKENKGIDFDFGFDDGDDLIIEYVLNSF